MDTILQLKISLRGTKPAIWRRVLVEKTTTFEALHEVIQPRRRTVCYGLDEFPSA